KYKKVADRVKPVATTLPSEYRIKRQVPPGTDPLAGLPTLPTNPPEFTPGERYTSERKEKMNINETGFLTDEEVKLIHHFMKTFEAGFAWDETEKGMFSEEWLEPIRIPTIEHIPFCLGNIPIPRGLYDNVVKILKDKIASGVYEPSTSSYRSRWFCVLKKDGKSLRLVHDLQPLNGITIK
ncbi:hypothetical protein FA15DRAFT_548025, partial [Coprinopsis marcescibilis]